MARQKSPPRTATVLRKDMLTPNMLRITFGGPGLADFPEDQNSAYIKLRLTEPDPDSDQKPLIRTYTVRDFNSKTHELDVDFVLHDIEGPAATWAKTCVAGDTIRMMGPGPKKLVDYSADWFLLVGDMSALPAISANIEGLPASARGYALLEIIDPADAQELDFPDALDVRWIINPHPDQAGTVLLDAVRKLDWPTGEPSIWVAGEFSTTLAVRKHLKEERGVPREQLYASSYWQMGRSEDEHKVSKAAARDD